ncbi:pacearchaeosortase [Candidatus Woesearchaeota archaeon]|nr:pacearchaeosortase [Candidatus Woesearchaeota archaeon]
MKYEKELILRLLISAIPLNLFYIILTPITIYVSYIFLIPLSPVLIKDSILINELQFDFVKACIAGAAYYLIFLLTMLTKEIKWKLRLKFIFYGFIAIFTLNIIRIVLLIYLATINYNYFTITHLIFWKFVSAIYVAFVWIFLITKFKIKSIPIYDDLHHLYKKSLFFIFFKNKTTKKKSQSQK